MFKREKNDVDRYQIGDQIGWSGSITSVSWLIRKLSIKKNHSQRIMYYSIQPGPICVWMSMIFTTAFTAGCAPKGEKSRMMPSPLSLRRY